MQEQSGPGRIPEVLHHRKTILMDLVHQIGDIIPLRFYLPAVADHIQVPGFSGQSLYQ